MRGVVSVDLFLFLGYVLSVLVLTLCHATYLTNFSIGELFLNELIDFA